MNGRLTGRSRQSGLSYVEVLLAVTVLALALVPALDALQTAFVGTDVQQQVAASTNTLASRMEEVLAEPFADLDDAALAAGSATTPSSYSDPGGNPDRVLVYLSRYDGDDADGNGDPFDAGADEGLLWVRVAMENSPYELTTLVVE